MSPQRFIQSPELQRFLSHDPVQGVLWSLAIIFIAFVLTRILRRFLPRYVDEPERRYKTTKMIGRFVGLAALTAILFVWAGEGLGLITVLTVIGAGLAIALREVVLSFSAWINIILRSPYKQGDRIEVNGIQGDVIDIRLLHSTLMEIGGWVDSDQSTGRILHFPNAWLYQFGIYNYTQGFGFIWNEIPFTVTFRSDWNAAREIMLELASETADIVEQQVKQEIRQMSREYLIHYSILTPFVYVRVTQNGVKLTLRYLTEVRKRRGTEHALTMGILEGFKQNGRIELAYGMVGVAGFESPQFGPLPNTQGEAPGGPAQRKGGDSEQGSGREHAGGAAAESRRRGT